MNYDPNDFAGDEGIYLAEKVFDEKFENNPIVTKLKMKSFDASRLFELDSLDFVYIDGNHQYEFIKSDLENYYPRVKKGGIISGHDYEWKGTPDVKKAVDEFFKKPPLKKYADHSWLYIKE
jgi:predicted O-methyltransferase YrrM